MAIGTQPPVITTRSTLTTSSTNLHVRDVEDKIKLLQPYPTPIDNWFITNKKFATQETTGIRTKFEWYEDQFLPSSVTLTAGLTGGSPTQAGVAVSGNYFKQNDVIYIEATDQVLTVTAVTPGSLTIDVMTSYGGNITATGGGAIAQILAPSFAEGAAKGTSLSVVAVLKYGYCQIMKKMLSMSGRQQSAKLYGGSDWKYQWQKALLELRESVERAWCIQGASYDEAGGTGRTYSAGFNSLTTNWFTYAGTLTKATWDNAIKNTMKNGSSNRLMAFAGGDALTDISAFIQQIWSIQQTKSSMSLESYGLLTTSPTSTKLVDYIHPMGIVEIHYSPQLKSKFAGDVILVNPENIKKRYAAPDEKGAREYRVEMGIETPGTDSYDSQYLMDSGLQIILEETHGRLRKL